METSDQSEVSIVIKLLERVELLEQELKKEREIVDLYAFGPKHHTIRYSGYEPFHQEGGALSLDPKDIISTMGGDTHHTGAYALKRVRERIQIQGV